MNLKKINCDISFFVPCLNEQENIIPTIKTIQSSLQKLNFVYEIFIVDDNSSDNTHKVVEKFKDENPDEKKTL